MKAEEYFNKYYKSLISEDLDTFGNALFNLCYDMLEEAKIKSGFTSLKNATTRVDYFLEAIYEQNLKGNEIVKMFDKPVIKENFFQRFFSLLQERRCREKVF